MLLFLLDFKVLDYVLRYFRTAVVSDFFLKLGSELLNLSLELLGIFLYIRIFTVLSVDLHTRRIQAHLITLLILSLDSFLWNRSDTALYRLGYR